MWQGFWIKSNFYIARGQFLHNLFQISDSFHCFLFNQICISLFSLFNSSEKVIYKSEWTKTVKISDVSVPSQSRTLTGSRTGQQSWPVLEELADWFWKQLTPFENRSTQLLIITKQSFSVVNEDPMSKVSGYRQRYRDVLHPNLGLGILHRRF